MPVPATVSHQECQNVVIRSSQTRRRPQQKLPNPRLPAKQPAQQPAAAKRHRRKERNRRAARFARKRLGRVRCWAWLQPWLTVWHRIYQEERRHDIRRPCKTSPESWLSLGDSIYTFRLCVAHDTLNSLCVRLNIFCLRRCFESKLLIGTPLRFCL